MLDQLISAGAYESARQVRCDIELTGIALASPLARLGTAARTHVVPDDTVMLHRVQAMKRLR